MKKEKQQGVSLISLLIASAILVVLSTYVAFIMFDLAQLDLRYQAQQTAVTNARFIMTKIKQDVRAAQVITQPNPSQSANEFTIRVNDQDIHYYLENEQLIRQQGINQDALTSNQAKITELTAKHINDDQPTNKDSLKINFTIEWIGQLKPGQGSAYNYQTTVSLR